MTASDTQAGGVSLRERVAKAAETDVNPILLRDNGYITVSGVENGVVTVRMEGMCAHCPQVQGTFDAVVRKRLMQVPGVRDVQLDDADDEELLAVAKRILLAGNREGKKV